MNKYLSVLAVTAFLASCNSKYNQGFDQGFNETYGGAYSTAKNGAISEGEANGVAQGKVDGRADGYQVGNDEGWVEAFDTYASSDYRAGYTDGSVDGYDQGYVDNFNPGVSAGTQDGMDAGYADGYDAQYQNGVDVGYQVNYDANYNSNYSVGAVDGAIAGAEDGYAAGYDDNYQVSFDISYDIGYEDGYDAGFADGLGSSIKSKNPSVRLAAMVNSDLIDYSKLEKFDSKSVLETSVVFSHADGGTVDMEKLAALKEMHYLGQMAYQLESNFGLEKTASMRIAKVAHQFNKVSGSRNMSEKDAKEFSMQLVGFDLAEVRSAAKKSMKGNSKELDSLLQTASKTMGTSPEKLNKMISKIFN